MVKNRTQNCELKTQISTKRKPNKRKGNKKKYREAHAILGLKIVGICTKSRHAPNVYVSFGFSFLFFFSLACRFVIVLLSRPPFAHEECDYSCGDSLVDDLSELRSIVSEIESSNQHVEGAQDFCNL
ncbi:hypothetical protein HS088_TW13G00075 [Tripterygium wilfordii]|uniref:Uncharacterized protein n=1 Tax=Tripterygium wilfordii TaxID=458696 RepID=A0A7J7CSV5_TRIWF|nr:hypothetical protein HS088_TW13G00075 [Tripterygium wilfordii]